MNDLAARLTELGERITQYGKHSREDGFLCDEAADEIKRMQAEIERLNDVLDGYVEAQR